MHLEARGLEGEAATGAIEAGFAEAARRAALLLAERPGSEIDVLNHVPMQVRIALSPETFEALSLAAQVAESTGGAYDPTARSPLDRLWGIDTGTPHRPRDFEIATTLRWVDWTDVELDADDGSAGRLSRRTQIDLGPVAVGAILDGAADALVRAGASAALASARGVWVARNGEARPFAIALPPGGAGGGRARLALAGGGAALAIAGPSLATEDGEKLRLPLDPRSGRPAAGAEWALARCDSGARAGGVAAALLVLGAEAPAWLDANPGAEGALLLSGGHPFVSAGSGVVWEHAP